MLRSVTENSLFGILQTLSPALLCQILRWAKGWTSGSGPPYLNNWRKDTYTRTIAVFCENSPFFKFSVTSAFWPSTPETENDHTAISPEKRRSPVVVCCILARRKMLQLGLILPTFTAPQSFSAIVSWLIGRGNAVS